MSVIARIAGSDLKIENKELFNECPIGKRQFADFSDGECFEFDVVAKHDDGTMTFLVDGKIQRGKQPVFWIQSRNMP